MSNKRILLAEDNIINQKVALHQLAKLGYAADAVSNGREAVDMLERIPYNVVLMDCQMPEMDGYEATAAIRLREGTSKHTPIIAMTAHTMEGERAKCLAAGMDDYISKPVKIEELEKLLEEWLFIASLNTDDSVVTIEKDEAPPIDTERLFTAMGDDPEEVREILDIYLEQMESNLVKLIAAIEAGDAKEVDLIAHNCAGVSANCGMNAVAIPLRELERMGRENQLDGAAQFMSGVVREFERTKLFLQRMKGMR